MKSNYTWKSLAFFLIFAFLFVTSKTVGRRAFLTFMLILTALCVVLKVVALTVEKMKPWRKVSTLGFIMVFFLLFILAGEYTYPDAFAPFLAISLSIGLASGMVAVFLSVKDEKFLFFKIQSTLVNRLVTFLVVVCMVTGMSEVVAMHLNYYLDGAPHRIETEIVDMDYTKRNKGGTTYYFTIAVDGDEVEIKVPHQHYEQYNEGDIYTVPYYEGAFGEAFYLPDGE